MRVLKFGGTSVGSVANINQVINIVKNGAQDQHIAVVVSALGGITDLLMQAGTDASNKDDYNTAFKDIEAKHIEFTRTLIPDSDEALDEIKNLLKSLESLLQGIYLINELSPKTVDKLLAYGEILSSSIILSDS